MIKQRTLIDYARAAAMGWMIKQRTLIDYATTWLPRHRIGSKGAPD